ncbi:taste receptor type 2 member 3-like [Sarcophilus harrisii]|uniref:Taste receptor type 2 n=1 Tax=Sarcophilus harrisii TaxID=9305 RepID=A0A7N4PTJ5_SARHA|nr:taste receptor type 2 member 3-like [Sarcophilus harrisii]
MLSAFQIFFMLMTLCELILGIWGNGFLGFFNCIHWIKRNKISLSDFIIMNLAFTRVILHFVVTFDSTVLMLGPDFFCEMKLMAIRDACWTFSNYLNIWLSTCLSVFYCLKIAVFSHPAFFWLKRRISQVTAGILLVCVLFFFFNTVLMIQKYYISFALLKMRLIINYTENVRRKERESYVFHFLSFLWTLVPFIISLFSCLLLILSLKRHTRVMGHHTTAPRDMSTTAHVRATKVIFSYLLLFVFYFVIQFIGTSTILLKDAKVMIMIVELVAPVYPSVHSFILILQNKTLKEAFLRQLWFKKGCVKGGARGCCTP